MSIGTWNMTPSQLENVKELTHDMHSVMQKTIFVVNNIIYICLQLSDVLWV